MAHFLEEISSMTVKNIFFLNAITLYTSRSSGYYTNSVKTQTT